MNDTNTTSHAIATVGTRSAQGGTVISGCEQVLLHGNPVARVGDRVRYPDGREARIITGARRVFIEERAIAATGSRLDNGDMLTIALHNDVLLCGTEDEPALSDAEEVA